MARASVEMSGRTTKKGRPHLLVEPAPILLAGAVLQTIPGQDRLEGYARRFYNSVQRALTPVPLCKRDQRCTREWLQRLTWPLGSRGGDEMAKTFSTPDGI